MDLQLDEAFAQLEKVLEVFPVNKWTLKSKKSSFFQKENNYLGRDICKDGVRPGKEKIEPELWKQVK